jgi:hypothetical protein
MKQATVKGLTETVCKFLTAGNLCQKTILRNVYLLSVSEISKAKTFRINANICRTV